MSDIAIRVENLGKKYTIGANQARYQTVRESLTNVFHQSFRTRKGQKSTEENTIWALKDINFDVKHGEVLGIIGRNGAGKSTLLKILARITKPTTGRIELNGRVGSLLEVGTGFHPELTGRENIYLSGAILGMKRQEIIRKFDEIVAFAEIEKFLDTPAKHYSSGMYMRLAFAVAAHLEPEILLVDEVLAVGDAEFQKKCLGKIGDVAKEGRTVLFVSHNMGVLRELCKSGALINFGKLAFIGEISTTIMEYITNGSITRNDKSKIIDHGFSIVPHIVVSKITVNKSSYDQLYFTPASNDLTIDIDGILLEPSRLALEIRFLDKANLSLGYYCPAHFDHKYLTNLIFRGNFKINATIKFPKLTKGDYYLDFYLTDPSQKGLWECKNGLQLISESTPIITASADLEYNRGFGAFILPGDFEIS